MTVRTIAEARSRPTCDPHAVYREWRIGAITMSDMDIDGQVASYALLGSLTAREDARRTALADELTARRHARKAMQR